MARAFRLGLMVIGLLGATWGCAHRPVERRPRLRIAILPEYSLHLVSQRYHPLLEHLEREMGARVEWISASTWEGYPAAVERQRPHFAWQDAYLTSLLVKAQGARPLLQALVSPGQGEEKGLVVVRQGSPLATLRGLRGRRVAVPSRRAFLSGLAQADLCRKEGIEPGRDFLYVVTGRTDRALLWVLEGKADAAFVRASALEWLPSDIGRESLRTLAETQPFPSDFLVAFPHTPPEWVAKVQEILTTLDPTNPTHAELLRSLGIAGFVPVEQPSLLLATVQNILDRLLWPL